MGIEHIQPLQLSDIDARVETICEILDAFASFEQIGLEGLFMQLTTEVAPIYEV